MRTFYKTSFAVIAFLILSVAARSQNNAVAIGTSSTNPNAVLLLFGNGKQGLIIPTTTDHLQISTGSNETGMIVFNTATKQVYVFDGTAWATVGGGGGSGTTYTLGFDNTFNSITLKDNTTSVLQSIPIQISKGNVAAIAPSNSQVLMYNGVSNVWTPVTLSGDIASTNTGITKVTGLNSKVLPAFSAGALTSDAVGNLSWTAPASGLILSNGQILTGNGATNAATALSGDASLIIGSLTINPGVITGAKIAASTISGGNIVPNPSIGGTLSAANLVSLGALTSTGALTVGVGGTTTFGGLSYTWPSLPLTTGNFLQTDNLGNLSWTAQALFTTPNVVPKGSAGGLVASGIYENALGDVGIGTVTPSFPLDIKTPTNAYGLNHSDGTVVMSTYAGNGGAYGGAIGTQSDHPFFIYTAAGGARMTILGNNGGINTGGVGIGTPTPLNRLDIAGGAVVGSAYAGINTAPSNGLLVQGNVGIGTVTPSSIGILHVAGGNIAVDGTAANGIVWVNGNTYQAHMHRFGAVNSNLYVTNAGSSNLTGVYLASGAVNWTSTSDRRLKENIVETSYGLDEILRLSVKEFNFRTTKEKDKKIGFIAQEVYKVIPEIVQKGDDGEYSGSGNAESSKGSGFAPWGVDYAGLTPILVKSTQEQQKQIAYLKKQIEELKAQQSKKETTAQLELNRLKSEIANIKKALGMEASGGKKK